MKKKYLIFLFVFLLAILLFFFNSSFFLSFFRDNDFRDFSVKEVDKIEKIFIVDYERNSALLTKKDSIWYVNQKYESRPENIKLILYALKNMEVRSPVAKAAMENVIRRMSTSALKMEIYDSSDDIIKTYYIGGATSDRQGTFMLLEKNGIKSIRPYIVYLPGFYGFLSARFFTKETLWRKPTVFEYENKNNIKSIQVKYSNKDSLNSFILKNRSGEFFITTNEVIQKKLEALEQLKEYFNRYKNVYFEMFVESSHDILDSLKKVTPQFMISVTDKNNEIRKIVAYRAPNLNEEKDLQGNLYPYDMTRMYAVVDDELVYIQYLTFDKLTVKKQYLLKTNK